MKLTHKIKTLSALLIAAGAVATSGCVSQSNTLSFTPPAPTASMNMAQSAIVTVSSKECPACTGTIIPTSHATELD